MSGNGLLDLTYSDRECPSFTHKLLYKTPPNRPRFRTSTEYVYSQNDSLGRPIRCSNRQSRSSDSEEQSRAGWARDQSLVMMSESGGRGACSVTRLTYYVRLGERVCKVPGIDQHLHTKAFSRVTLLSPYPSSCADI